MTGHRSVHCMAGPSAAVQVEGVGGGAAGHIWELQTADERGRGRAYRTKGVKTNEWRTEGGVADGGG